MPSNVLTLAPALAELGQLTPQRVDALANIVARRAPHELPRMLWRLVCAMHDAGVRRHDVCEALLAGMLDAGAAAAAARQSAAVAQPSVWSTWHRPRAPPAPTTPQAQARPLGKGGSAGVRGAWADDDDGGGRGAEHSAHSSVPGTTDPGVAARGGADTTRDVYAHYIAAAVELCVAGGYYSRELFARAADLLLLNPASLERLRGDGVVALVRAYATSGHTHLMLLEALAARAEALAPELTLRQAAALVESFSACGLYRRHVCVHALVHMHV